MVRCAFGSWIAGTVHQAYGHQQASKPKVRVRYTSHEAPVGLEQIDLMLVLLTEAMMLHCFSAHSGPVTGLHVINGTLYRYIACQHVSEAVPLGVTHRAYRAGRSDCVKLTSAASGILGSRIGAFLTCACSAVLEWMGT